MVKYLHMNQHEQSSYLSEKEYASDESVVLSEKQDDSAFSEECQNPEKIPDALSRLKVIKNLRFISGNSMDNPEREKERMTKLEYHESHPNPHGVTMGIEIEIPEESVLPEEAKSWNKGEKKKYFYEMKEKYAETEKMGVPAGKDHFWEFANSPVQYPATLSREVQALIGLGLINPDYDKFPLHLTLGGISFSPDKNDISAHVLARVLDATGWVTTGDRLIAPYTDPDSNWTSHDSLSGIRERGTENIIPMEGRNSKTAVEYRTPLFSSLFGLDRYLHSMYYLGSALRAYQEQKKDDPVEKQLSKIWRVFSGKCESVFEDYGLKSPGELWTLDTENPDEHSPFKELSKVLEKAEKDPESKEAKFIHEVRELIISTRAEIKELFEKNEK